MRRREFERHLPPDFFDVLDAGVASASQRPQSAIGRNGRRHCDAAAPFSR